MTPSVGLKIRETDVEIWIHDEHEEPFPTVLVDSRT